MLLSTTRRSLHLAAVLLSGALIWSLAPPAYTATAYSDGGQLSSVKPTVRKWLENLEEGKSRKAWRLMTKQSRRAIGGFEEFEKESSAWAEGWGAWARARRRDFEVRVIAPKDNDADSVVTMTGLVAQEGSWSRSAAALPVITHDGVTKVDPIHGRAEISAVRPSRGETLTRRPRFKAAVRHIRARSNSVYFVIKGSGLDPQRARLERTGRRSYSATLRWPSRLTAGRHVLTVSIWGRAGFKALAVPFKVEQ